jgi:zinc protease
MLQLPRAALAAAIVLAMAGSAAALGLPKLHSAKPPAAAAKLKPGQWPQAQSDLPADPAIRFGALPNGMRYAIMKNATPPGQASLRLRFDAGSMMETDAQAGLAHFLEHMAFNGSNHVPPGEMLKILERHGLAFGADTNASTSFDATVYKLDLPKTDADTVDTSLMLLRETASELTLNQKDIDEERGVVLSEERARDTPSYRIFKSRFGFYLEGQRPPERYPIGKVEVIKAATHDLIADYYHKYYRPERATLIAVGDFDVDAMEAKIKAKFGDWAAVGPAGADPDLGQVMRRGQQTRLAVEPGSPTSIQLAWITPPDLAADTAAHRKQDLIERLGLAVLNRRLSTLSRADNPPFIGAGAFRGNQLRAVRMTTLLVNAEQTQWKTALAVAEQEQRRAVRYGVRPDELTREIAELEAALKQAAAQAATRRTPNLADEIEGTLDDVDVETSPAEDLALFHQIKSSLTPEQVTAALKTSFVGAGPLLFMSSPVAIDGGQAAVQTAYNEAHGKDVAAPTALAAVQWPYEDFGDPGKVVDQREVSDLDAVFVRFANGVRLTVKPTKFRDDQVLVKVRAGSGLQGLPADRQSLSWAGYAFVEGGLKKISADDTERVLASTVYGADYRIEDDAFVLTGATRRDDLPTQLQVLAAYISEPAWRPEPMARMKTYTATLLDQYAATDSGVLGRDLAGLIHSGDRRWTFPTRDEITAATLDDLKAQMSNPITGGPVEVLVVGDITVDKAIEAVAATFGALPQRPEPPAAGAPTVAFPGPNATPVVLTHKGRADQAIGFEAWRTTDFFADPQAARNVSILGEVLQLRLDKVLREEEGVTYSPQVGYTASFTWKGWGYLSARAEVPPDKLPSFFADIAKIAADLRDKDVTADELDRARKPRLEQIGRSRVTNEYWLAALSGAQADPRRLDAIRSEIAGIEKITPADVRRAAQQYLRDDAAWKLEVRPATAQAGAPPAAANHGG